MYRNVKFHFILSVYILSYNKPIYKINDTINLKLIWRIEMYKLYYTQSIIKRIEPLTFKTKSVKQGYA